MIELGIVTDYRDRLIIEALLEFWSQPRRIEFYNFATDTLASQIFNQVFSIGPIVIVAAVADVDFGALGRIWQFHRDYERNCRPFERTDIFPSARTCDAFHIMATDESSTHLMRLE